MFFQWKEKSTKMRPMGFSKWLLTAITCVFVMATCTEAVTDRVVCYYTNWSVYRSGVGSFAPTAIDPDLCTHLIYAFGGFTKEGVIQPSDNWQDIDKDGYAQFTGLKNTNPNLKTMIGIGGTNEGSATFSHIASVDKRRKEFVQNVIKFLRQRKFDGVDLDWNRPAYGKGSKPEDKENLVKLVRDMREGFASEAEGSESEFLISMSVPRERAIIERGYDIPELNKYVDWMDIKCYDYHSVLDEFEVHHHAPLYATPTDPNDILNVNNTVQYYIDAGVDREKLVLGIPAFGRSYTLADSEVTAIGSNSTGPGEKAPFTNEYGYMAYYEICSDLKDKEWTVERPFPEAMGPFAYKGRQWVGYDDVQSVEMKARYVNQQGMGGVMFWTIDNDDFHGTCHGNTFPLINAAKNALKSKSGISPEARTEVTQTSKETPEVATQSSPKFRTVPGVTGSANEVIEPKILCYYTTWSTYREGAGKFTPKNIDPFLCTHILYAYAEFSKEGEVTKADNNVDVNLNGYVTFTGLKVANPKLKAMLVIGGTNQGSAKFTYIVEDDGRRKTFVRNSIKFMRDNKFDGLVLNWNAPASGKGKPEDKENYGLLVRELNEQFVAEAEAQPRLELSITITHGKDVIDMGYDLPAINKYVDWVSVRTYDYHEGLDPTVNHPHPLYSLDDTRDDQLNADSTLQYLINNGLNRSKMLFLIATFGRTFTLEDPESTDLGSPASGPGEKGEFTGTKGFLSTYEICSNLQQNNGSDDDWTVVQPKPQAAGPYAFKGDQWVGYDDAPTVALKGEYAARLGLAGLTFWTIDMDDFLGTCNQGPYPLITAGKNAFYKALGIPVSESDKMPVTIADPAFKFLPTESSQALDSTLTSSNDDSLGITLPTQVPVPVTKISGGGGVTPILPPNTDADSTQKEAVTDRVVCYYTNWSIYRSGVGSFAPTAIDPHLCTHLIYAFGGFTKEGVIQPSDNWQDVEKDGYAQFTGLKNTNPNLKTMIGIGGTNEGSATFSHIASVDKRRKEFVQNVIKFLRLRKFDGVDLDWNRPAYGRGSKPEDKENLVKLVRDMREGFASEAEGSESEFLISMSVPRERAIIERGYDIPELNKYVDWMDIKCYDYHSVLDEFEVHHHAPLYATPTNPNDILNVNNTVQYYIDAGVDREKLVLGIPAFGRSYTLADPEVTAIGSNSTGPGEKAPFTNEYGYMAYYEICSDLKDKEWTVERPFPEAMGPFAYKGRQWVGYDDVQSVEMKARYVNQQGMGGVMFWTIDNDDFHGTCHGNTFPLINAAKNALKSKSGNSPVALTEVTQTSKETPEVATQTSPNFRRVPGVTASANEVIEPKILCYYTSWSTYREGAGKFTPKNIDPFLCTHILYAYARFSKEGEVTNADHWLDVNLDGYETFTDLKVANPKLKAMVVIGGTYQGSITFTYIVEDEGRRKTFVRNSIKFMRDNKFDGLVLNWNTPASGKGKPEDKENYALLMQEFNEQFVAEAEAQPRLELSITITHGKDVIDMGYDFPAINKYVDWVSVRTYDYYEGIEPTVNHPHPLYSLDDNRDDQLNADSTLQYLINNGLNRSKMLFLIATFGRTFTLEDPQSTDLGSPASGPGEKGEFTGTKGFLSTYEICSNLQQNNGSDNDWTVVQPKPQAAGPYAFKGDQWVGYDDAPTVALKGEYAARLGLAGLTFWTIDMDDFLGTCNQGPYPLITAGKNAFYKALGIPIPESDKIPVTTTESSEALNSTSSSTNVDSFRITLPTQVPTPVPKISGGGGVTPILPPKTDADSTQKVTEPRVVCYYTASLEYKSDAGKLPIGSINPHLCTHLIYAFGTLTEERLSNSSISWQGISTGGYAAFNRLKLANPKLKTLLALGGNDDISASYSSILSDGSKRRTLTQNILKYLRENGFDGIDLSWNYPSVGNRSRPEDKQNLVKFVQELRREFDSEARTGSPLLLTVDVPGYTRYIERGYDISQLNRYVDWFGIQAFDYQTWLFPEITHVAPLYAASNADDEWNADFSVQYVINAGADPAKLVLGIPTYGRTFTLKDPGSTGFGSTATGPGLPGPITGEAGSLAYHEICSNLLSTNGPNMKWTAIQPYSNYVGPYAYKGDQWVGYDDVNMVKRKAQYAAHKGLGGIMFWSLNQDDFTGTCHGRAFPLIESGKEAFYESLGIDSPLTPAPPTAAPTTARQTTVTSTTARPTTATPTTARPTTATPTTAKPTPARPTTATPTTAIQTTARPTTAMPTTATPTTGEAVDDTKPSSELANFLNYLQKIGGIEGLQKILSPNNGERSTSTLRTPSLSLPVEKPNTINKPTVIYTERPSNNKSETSTYSPMVSDNRWIIPEGIDREPERWTNSPRRGIFYAMGRTREEPALEQVTKSPTREANTYSPKVSENRWIIPEGIDREPERWTNSPRRGIFSAMQTTQVEPALEQVTKSTTVNERRGFFHNLK